MITEAELNERMNANGWNEAKREREEKERNH